MKRWSKREESTLFNLIKDNVEIKQISVIMNRSVVAISKKLAREGFECIYVYRRKDN